MGVPQVVALEVRAVAGQVRLGVGNLHAQRVFPIT